MHISFRKTPKIITPSSQEYKNLSRIKQLNMISLLVIFFVFSMSLWFVYTNIYQTIGKVQILLITNPNMGFEPINFKLYTDTLAAWDARTALPPLSSIRDPFHEVRVTTTTPSNTPVMPALNSVQGQL
ncbi:MAG: hypothetical protein HYV41_00985 [Candidatus Magasanikbacteria bacterium]|nr:hypothetical protein [Candidatus Magasanikbacteria bacterium]